MSHQGREVRRALSVRLAEVVAEFAARLPEDAIAEELSRLGGDLRVRPKLDSPGDLPQARWLPQGRHPATLEVEVGDLATFERIWRAVLGECRVCVRVAENEERPPGALCLRAPGQATLQGLARRGTLTLRVRRSHRDAGAMLLEIERPGLATRLRGEELRRILGAGALPNDTAALTLPAPPPTLGDQPPSYRVHLAHRPFSELLREHLGDPRAGYLQVAQAQRTTTFLVARRAVWEVWQTPYPESIALSTLLLRGGQIDARQLAQASERAARHQTSLERALLDLGMISARHLALTRRARILYALDPTGTQWQRGEASFYPLDEEPILDASTRVELGTHLFARALKEQQTRPPAELIAGMRELGAGPFELVERPGLGRRQLAASPQITPVVRALAQSACRPASLMELDLDEETLAATMLTLHRFDLLKTRTPRFRESASGDEAFDDPTIDRLLRLDARSMSDDHFSFLDLHWSAYTRVIQQTYLEMRAQILDAELPPHHHDLKARLLARLDLAHDTLAHPESRAHYRDTITDAWTRNTTCDALRDQLDQARHEGCPNRALDLAQRILELDPDCAQTRAIASTLRASRVPHRFSSHDPRKD